MNQSPEEHESQSHIPRGVTLYIALLCAVAVALFALTWPSHPRVSWLDLTIFAVCITLAETWWVRMGPDSGMSLSFAMDFAAVILYGPALGAMVAAVGVLAADGVIKRRPLSRTIFNTAQVMITVVASGVVFKQLGHGGRVSLSADALALVVAGAVYLIVNNTLVTSVISISGRPFFQEWFSSFRDIGVPYVSMAPLGSLVAYTFQASPWTLLYFIPLVLVIYNGFKLFVTLQHETDHALVALADSIDKRDQYTFQHSVRVARYAGEIARRLDLSMREVDLIVSAARVHDLGKIATDNRVLFKQSSLTDEERDLIRSHPAEGGDLAGKFSMFRSGRAFIRHHHERWDGQGYPDGLGGGDIPLGARIISVADAYDAMTSDRPYRRALSHEVALIELQRGAGKQFDPSVVAAFVNPQRDQAAAAAAAALERRPQESCSFS